MDLTIQPRPLRGELTIIPSKSLAHRLLICAAFSDVPTQLACSDTNQDIEATADCLRALGAQITRTASGYHVVPVSVLPQSAVLNCCESGSTLRFLLPIVGALGIDTLFQMAGRLPQRPLSPLWEEMERMGCHLCRPSQDTIRCTGKLQAGHYRMDGGVSSQYITGLLFAHSLMTDPCTLEITGTVESKPYIALTQAVLNQFHAPQYHSPGDICVEGDWSNAAFFLSANALGSQIDIHGLNPTSVQGDRAIVTALQALRTGRPLLDVADIPDLVPILAVTAACQSGCTFTNIRRLRLKESDRVATVLQMLENLGGRAEATADTLTVFGTPLHGGTVNAHNDHRIAMAAAIAATVCTQPVTILGAQAVAKSYPRFWEEYGKLGGIYEQHIR